MLKKFEGNTYGIDDTTWIDCRAGEGSLRQRGSGLLPEVW